MNTKSVILVAVILFASLFNGMKAQAATSDFVQGVKAYQIHSYVQARSYFQNHISSHSSNNAPAYYYLASCHYNMNQLPEAQKYFTHCLELRPDAQTAKYAQQALVAINQQMKSAKTTIASANNGVSTINVLR